MANMLKYKERENEGQQKKKSRPNRNYRRILKGEIRNNIDV